MQKTSVKALSKLMAVVLVVGLMATTAFAAWPVYGGNANHNAVVTSAPTSTAPDIKPVKLINSGSGWSGVDNVPVMETVGGVTYTYVLYDGHAGGAHLAKIKCSDATTVWDVQLSTSSGFQLSTPLLDNGVIYAALNGGSVIKVSNLSSTTEAGVKIETIATVESQINTPVTIRGGYLYFGTWSGNGTVEGSGNPGHYYQLNLKDTSDLQSVTSIKNGFYWAGAVTASVTDGGITQDYVYFGGDGGYLYYRPVGTGFAASTPEAVKAGAIALPNVAGNAPGDVRSTIMRSGSDLYFTSKGSSNGNFYCYTVGTNGVPSLKWAAKLGGNCTSTPVLADSGNLYVGFYSGFANGGLQKLTAPASGTTGTATTITVGGAAFDQPVQCTPVVYTVTEEDPDTGDVSITDYFYFNTNSQSGAGYCFSVLDGSTNATQIWKTVADTYALGGTAIENGYAVFGNDYNHLYIVH